jgi:hypothetical protein
MKSYLSCALILLFATIACNYTPDAIAVFIPGTYTRFHQEEFGPVYDTITIQKMEVLGSNYIIERTFRFQRMVDGKISPWENKTESSTATYNPESKQLYDNRFDKTMHFAPDKHQLLIGNAVYDKLNQ